MNLVHLCITFRGKEEYVPVVMLILPIYVRLKEKALMVNNSRFEEFSLHVMSV